MKRKKSSIITKIIIAALLIYASVTLVTLCVRIKNAKAGQEQLKEEAANASAEVAEMEYAIENKDDDEVIEDVARKKLGLVMPDEEIYYND